MKASTVPGYLDLFSDQNDKYEYLVEKIPSETVIRICAALNNELNGPGGAIAGQDSIYRAITHRFSDEQKADLKVRLSLFQKKIGDGNQIRLFATRYLLDMILKELNNFREAGEYTDDIENEYKLLKAYLLVTDETAKKDQNSIDFESLKKVDPDLLFKLMWLPLLGQFEYNEKSNLLFETYKSFCFFKYVSIEYRPYLKEFINRLGFNSVGEYLNSFSKIGMSIANTDNTAPMLRRLNYIVPKEGIDHTHLKKLSANLLSQTEFKLVDIKKAPLCYAQNRNGYIVIDYNYINKKMFRGAFFEICHETSLTTSFALTAKQRNTIFNNYSQKVSNEFEKSYFMPVMKLFNTGNKATIHFDNGSKSVPDCYMRVGNRVFLFEYKAYVFPEEHIVEPNFEKMKKYLDNRFVQSDTKSSKGVGQLLKQLDCIINKEFHFDSSLYKVHKESGLYIYPIIIYNDFNFSMPGFNTYLNNKLMEELPKLQGDRMNIYPLVMTNLETIMDMAVVGQDVTHFEAGIHNYFKYLEYFHRLFAFAPNQMNLVESNKSFDEFYKTQIAQPSNNKAQFQKNLHLLLDLANIRIEDFNQHLD